MPPIKVNFTVDPEFLKHAVIIENPKRIEFIDMDLIDEAGILGETGRAMAKLGFPFNMRGDMADKLIKIGAARETTKTLQDWKLEKEGSEHYSCSHCGHLKPTNSSYGIFICLKNNNKECYDYTKDNQVHKLWEHKDAK